MEDFPPAIPQISQVNWAFDQSYWATAEVGFWA